MASPVCGCGEVAFAQPVRRCAFEHGFCEQTLRIRRAHFALGPSLSKATTAKRKEKTMANQINQITFEKVDDKERIAFLPKKLGTQCVKFENIVFSIMGRANPEYTGGFWDFYRLSNGGFFIAPDIVKHHIKMTWEDNYFSGSMTPNASGVACCLMALSWIEQTEKFHLLREFALDLPEAEKIFGFID